MSLYSRFIRRFSRRRWFAWTAARVAPPLDRAVFRATGGRRLATPSSIPTLLLTTVGRHSGDEHTVPLSFVTFDGHAHVVGTNFGQVPQPAWALNLLTTPRSSVSYEGTTWWVDAIPVAADERAPLWPLFDSIVPAYEAYRDRLDRPIHMFRLERV